MMFNPYRGPQPYVRAFFHDVGTLPAEIKITGKPHHICIAQPFWDDTYDMVRWEGLEIENTVDGIRSELTNRYSYQDGDNASIFDQSKGNVVIPINPRFILDEAMRIYDRARIWFD